MLGLCSLPPGTELCVAQRDGSESSLKVLEFHAQYKNVAEVTDLNGSVASSVYGAAGLIPPSGTYDDVIRLRQLRPPLERKYKNPENPVATVTTCVVVLSPAYSDVYRVFDKSLRRSSRHRVQLGDRGSPSIPVVSAAAISACVDTDALWSTDTVCAAITPDGKKSCLHIGRVAIRTSGSCRIQIDTGVAQGVSHRDCRIIHIADGYAYTAASPTTRTEGAVSPSPEGQGLRREKNR